MSINSINGIRQIKSYFKDAESIKNFVVTPSLLKEVRNAWKKYDRLELAAQNKIKNNKEIDNEHNLRAEEVEMRKEIEKCSRNAASC